MGAELHAILLMNRTIFINFFQFDFQLSCSRHLFLSSLSILLFCRPVRQSLNNDDFHDAKRNWKIVTEINYNVQGAILTTCRKNIAKTWSEKQNL